jgi:hypothetical protein
MDRAIEVPEVAEGGGGGKTKVSFYVGCGEDGAWVAFYVTS